MNFLIMACHIYMYIDSYLNIYIVTAKVRLLLFFNFTSYLFFWC